MINRIIYWTKYEADFTIYPLGETQTKWPYDGCVLRQMDTFTNIIYSYSQRYNIPFIQSQDTLAIDHRTGTASTASALQVKIRQEQSQ